MSATIHTQRPATQPQLDLIDRLWNERETTDLTRPTTSALTSKAASSFITFLMGLPYKNTRTEVSYDVPEGRYAVEVGGVLRFYHVKHGKGRWDGRIFVNRQSSDEILRISRPEQAEALRLISEDPQEAMLQYGRKLEHCGHCGRALTDKESREAGIGPRCAAKLGH